MKRKSTIYGIPSSLGYERTRTHAAMQTETYHTATTKPCRLIESSRYATRWNHVEEGPAIERGQPTLSQYSSPRGNLES